VFCVLCGKKSSAVRKTVNSNEHRGVKMDVWKFLKSNFERTNKNWQLIVVQFITALIMVPIIILGIVIPVLVVVIPAVQGNCDGEDIIPLILDNLVFILLGGLIFLVFLLGIIILWAFVSGGIRGSLLENILTEKRFKFDKFMGYGKKFFSRIVGLWGLTGLIYSGIFIIFGGITSFILLFCIAFYETSEVGAILVGIFSGGFFFLVLMVVGFFMGVFLTIANTYLIIEDAQVIESMKGSIRFIKKYPGHTFLIIIILIAIGFAVGMVYTMLTMPLTVIPYVGAIFSAILSPIQMGLNLYLSLFGTTAYLLLYLWKRERIGSDFQSPSIPEKTM
jgi:hypothetical protein